MFGFASTLGQAEESDIPEDRIGVSNLQLAHVERYRQEVRELRELVALLMDDQCTDPAPNIGTGSELRPAGLLMDAGDHCAVHEGPDNTRSHSNTLVCCATQDRRLSSFRCGNHVERAVQ